MMKKRSVVFFGILTLGMFVTLLSVFNVSSGTLYAQTAEQQHTYKLVVSGTRGTVYDCNKNPLTGTGKKYAAAVAPSVEGAAALSKILPVSKMQEIYPFLTAGRPFTLMLPQNVKAAGVDVFPVDQRYADDEPAANILGYLDGSGKGAAGVEKAFDDRLSSRQGRVSVVYKVDALNRVLAGEERRIEDTSYLKNSGVVLTLDKNIQSMAERAAKKYLTKGAVVVTEVPSCKIRAAVSCPTFSPNNVAAALKSQDSPLLNRAFSAYSVGSVFKLVAASAALENGVSPDFRYTCTGAIDVDGGLFHCFNSEAHGSEDMNAAIANSCNTYFVKLMQQIPQSDFLSMAKAYGFGSAVELAPGLSSAPGVLPSLKSLSVPRALANFSFGQGELTATPLQVGAMVNAIASGGMYTEPSLYEGLVDETLEYTEKAPAKAGKRIVSERTASLLKGFMKSSIDSGTSRKGKPSSGEAGAKTATAQTGRFVDGKEQVESWFSGFYPYDSPRYVVTVFAEGGDGGGTTCGPVFRQIADELYKYIGG